MADELLTTREAAEALGVTLARVHQLIKAEILPAERLGARTVLIRAEHLELARRRRKPGKPPSPDPSPSALAKRRSREKRKGKVG